MIIHDYEIFGQLMLTFAKLGIQNKIMQSIYEDDGPYFALTKAERYVLKFKEGTRR